MCDYRCESGSDGWRAVVHCTLPTSSVALPDHIISLSLTLSACAGAMHSSAACAAALVQVPPASPIVPALALCQLPSDGLSISQPVVPVQSQYNPGTMDIPHRHSTEEHADVHVGCSASSAVPSNGASADAAATAATSASGSAISVSINQLALLLIPAEFYRSVGFRMEGKRTVRSD
jgi:hypothetical protein